MDHNTELVGKIAHEVYQSLGSGFSEDVYDRAMQVGLLLAGIEYESQKVVELKYRDHYVGKGYPDLLVHLGTQKIVVELKAVSGELGECEEKQLWNYMTILGVECEATSREVNKRSLSPTDQAHPQLRLHLHLVREADERKIGLPVF